MSVAKDFRGSAEVIEWLNSFFNLEQGTNMRDRFQLTYRLDRMEYLSKIAGNPETCAPLIHVAGSKGKGSVAGMIASILETAGWKTARYASPHVSDFRERICRGDNSFFTESVYIEAGNELAALLDDLPNHHSPEMALFDAANPEGQAPTYFELMTLYFFLCARLAKCDAMAVETGMGGRLDATNIASPLVSVITLIELEHTEFLGSSIPKIAWEKAGIVKQGRPLVLGAQVPEALTVFRDKTAQTLSPLLYFPDAAEISNLRISTAGSSFDLHLKKAAAHLKLSTPIPVRLTKISDGNESTVESFLNRHLFTICLKTGYISEETYQQQLAV
ncbi:bifunctional folylpolyglutamate synthase/dihydrofolate synthase [Breznakiellaceae bacterium SP9]